MEQLVGWNPALKADCSNLTLGQAYCVNGPTAAKMKRVLATPTAKAEEVKHIAKHKARHGGSRV